MLGPRTYLLTLQTVSVMAQWSYPKSNMSINEQSKAETHERRLPEGNPVIPAKNAAVGRVSHGESEARSNENYATVEEEADVKKVMDKSFDLYSGIMVNKLKTHEKPREHLYYSEHYSTMNDVVDANSKARSNANQFNKEVFRQGNYNLRSYYMDYLGLENSSVNQLVIGKNVYGLKDSADVYWEKTGNVIIHTLSTEGPSTTTGDEGVASEDGDDDSSFDDHLSDDLSSELNVYEYL